MGRSHYPDDIELLFQEGIALRTLGDLPGAKERWERILRSAERENTKIRGEAYQRGQEDAMRGGGILVEHAAKHAAAETAAQRP